MAKAAIPSVIGLAGMENNAASGELLWWMMKQAGQKNASKPSIGPNPVTLVSQMGLNFDLLPEFDIVRKYFGLLASYGISRPDGFFFEFKHLPPAESN